ncbi:thioredoxin peroxidase 1, putative [Theileria equi strain WA]|uniref:Thioredoxin peroxidase 1, putative n=1 Tax=Theileria equi strain WA TaxID=1537102 RepID=L0AYR9_THEEQ|nr:thioredoxin peroxidase 1, putative [Theileria equi strain WA]AFZ80715.1 thioredoxin peroxidase 1, putative [Theileria equi strain WA]|eukprot:XP_004830381.1 thioredoxin peroxidase 1, putative [Theileria equi strain WA]
MSLRVGLPAPLFKCEAVMPDGSFKEISLSDYLGKKYVCLFFYPLDFTFVCPTEIVAFNDAVAQFEARNVQILGCSVDSKFAHLAWRNTPRDKAGIGNVKFPILSDITKELSTLYDVLMPEAGISLRGLFLIDKKGVLQHSLVNNLPLGRNVNEVLRLVDALQNFETKGEVCPANWKLGEKSMPPTTEGVIAHLTTKLA